MLALFDSEKSFFLTGLFFFRFFILCDNNGFLSPADMKRVLAEYKKDITDQEMDEMIQLADTDRNGQLDYEEFVTLYSVHHGRKKSLGSTDWENPETFQVVG